MCQIFSNMYRVKADQRWRKFEFNLTKTSRKDKDPVMQMASDIEQQLIENELYLLPVAYIRPEVDEDLREEVTEILKNRSCEITTDESKATHIIYPEVDALPDDYARPSFRRGKNVMIHWYYFPESYDSWVPNTFDLPVCTVHTNEIENCVPMNWNNGFCWHLFYRKMFPKLLARHKMKSRKFGVFQLIGCCIHKNTTNGWPKMITKWMKKVLRKSIDID